MVENRTVWFFLFMFYIQTLVWQILLLVSPQISQRYRKRIQIACSVPESVMFPVLLDGKELILNKLPGNKERS